LRFTSTFSCWSSSSQGPPLKAIAPTQKEPPFVIAQIAVLALFGVLAVLATLRFRAEAKHAA